MTKNGQIDHENLLPTPSWCEFLILSIQYKNQHFACAISSSSLIKVIMWGINENKKRKCFKWRIVVVGVKVFSPKFRIKILVFVDLNVIWSTIIQRIFVWKRSFQLIKKCCFQPIKASNIRNFEIAGLPLHAFVLPSFCGFSVNWWKIVGLFFFLKIVWD